MNSKAIFRKIFIITLIGFLAYSCANRGQGPTGGLKDETPPKMLQSTPKNGTLNFKKKQIQLDFDELVSIEKATDNVIISPPQLKPPDVKSYGKRVTIDFNDELIDSTTYSINFGDAIVDLNEKNAVKNFLFSFSTGNEIDTLGVSGIVVNAEDLNPIAGIIVGIYTEKEDSVFAQKPFLRIGRTDENGHFSIDNIKNGSYKVFALGDANRDYFYQAGEGLAFYDSIVNPHFRIEEMRDTVWADSVTIDSVRTYMGTRFLPNDLVLKFFKENKKRQYFTKSERKEATAFSLYFNTEQESLPVLKPLNFEWDGKYLLQKNNTMDSLTYWIKDSLVWKKDTLEFEMKYMKSDSIFQLIPATDTISVVYRRPKINVKSKSMRKDPAVIVRDALKFTTNVSGTHDLYRSFILRFQAPLANIDVSKIKLSEKIDTVFKDLKFTWGPLDSTFMNYRIDYKWVPEKSYKLAVDSGAFVSIYNAISDDYVNDFKIRSLDEYSSVKIVMAQFDSLAVLQMLDTKDVVVSTKPAQLKGTLFEYLKPGDYYVRMFIDSNKNGVWDAGDFSSHRHPEEVYYYTKKLTLMANWEFEESWDYKSVPLLQQKAAELRKVTTKKK